MLVLVLLPRLDTHSSASASWIAVYLKTNVVAFAKALPIPVVDNLRNERRHVDSTVVPNMAVAVVCVGKLVNVTDCRALQE